MLMKDIIIRYLKKNIPYILMVIFLVSVQVFIFVENRSSRPESETRVTRADETTERFFMFDPDEMKAREEKVRRLAYENPKLYMFLGLVNLSILFALFTGFILDIYFSIRILRKKPVMIRSNRREDPRWSISDVCKVALIFLSFGYVCAIVQAVLADKISILVNENFNMVFNTALMNIVGISVILYFAVKKYGHRLPDLGLTGKKMARNVFYAVTGYISLLPVLLVILVITFVAARMFEYKPPLQPIVKVFMEEKQTGILWLSAVFAAVFGPVAEEIFFRGFMYPAIKRITGGIGAVIITSVIFAALHAHLAGFMPIMALGILLAYLYEKTGSLASSMAVHIMHNLSMVCLVFLVRSIGM